MRIPPIVLLLIFLAVKAISAEDVYVWKTAPFTRCPLIGEARPGTSKANQNKQKNRWHFPAAAQFDRRVTLAALLEPGADERRWNSRKAARIVGYVASVGPGGIRHGESCNCGAQNAIDGDTHIDVVPDSDRATVNNPSKKIVVEVTPRIREIMATRGVDWKTETLKDLIEGEWVEFEGWLFFDPDHRTGSVNSDPNDAVIPERNWRASGWEIHPVTKIRVLPGRPRALRSRGR